MKVCPVAIAVGCAKCPVFKVCTLKSVLGDQPAKSDSPAAHAGPAKSTRGARTGSPARTRKATKAGASRRK